MAFKTEELMIQVLPGKWVWAAGKDDPGEGPPPDTACRQNSQKPCCAAHTCGEKTNPASVCQAQSQKHCESPQVCADGVTCENGTQKVWGAAARASGLDLLRWQMKERLSQDLTS